MMSILVATTLSIVLVLSTIKMVTADSTRVRSHATIRDLDENNGGCSSSQQSCFEVHSGQYQAFGDGFCNEYNQCGGARPNSECICRNSNYEQPPKNYVFEQTSGYSRIASYYPYMLPSHDMGNFVDGPGSSLYVIHNVSAPDYSVPKNELARYEFHFKEDTMEGSIEPIVDIPLVWDLVPLNSEVLFSFRVLVSGTYQISASAVGHESTGFRFNIDDRDYHFSEYLKDGEASVELEEGHDYLLSVKSHLLGAPGESRMSWSLRPQI